MFEEIIHHTQKATQTFVFFLFLFLFSSKNLFGTTHEKEKHRTHAFGIAATVRDHRRCDHCYWWHPIRRARVTHGET